MTALKVATLDGFVTVQAPNGQSLMEALRDSGFEDIQALCGGCCSCATCHVVIDAGWTDRLPPVSSDESDLLDSIDGRSAGSRLSCQIPITDGLDGMVLTVPPTA